MTLLQAWGDSLTLLQPKNLKLFVLVTLKSIGETYKLLLKYWWWLFVLNFFASYGFDFMISCLALGSRIETIISSIYLVGMILVLPFFYLFITCLATRPSIELKTCAYFRRYMFYFFYISLCFCMEAALTPFIVLVVKPVLKSASFLVPLIIMIPLNIWAILFFLDSVASVKNAFYAFFNAVKMIVFNFPLCIFFGLVGLTCKYGMSYIFSYVIIPESRFFIQADVALIFAPIVTCIYANIYIKKLHEQFDLYFKQPK